MTWLDSTLILATIFGLCHKEKGNTKIVLFISNMNCTGGNQNSPTSPTFILGEYRSNHTCDMWTKYRPTYLCRCWIRQFWHGHYTNEFWNLNYCFSKMGYQGGSNPMRQELCVSLQTCSPQSEIWIKVAIKNLQFQSNLAHTLRDWPPNEYVNLWKYEQNWSIILDFSLIASIIQIPDWGGQVCNHHQIVTSTLHVCVSGAWNLLLLELASFLYIIFRPPSGCLQWHTGLTGQITTFNFLNSAGTHLASQK